MKVLYMAMNWNDHQYEYDFNGETIKINLVKINKIEESNEEKNIAKEEIEILQTDTFDLSSIEYGDKFQEVETSLPIAPIDNAWRDENGELFVICKKFHNDGDPEEKCFPDRLGWQEV